MKPEQRAGSSTLSGPVFTGMLLLLFQLTACSTEPENKPPVAGFTVTPELGLEETEFVFNATSCTDPDDQPRFLQVRWDWNGDDVWDTLWGAAKQRTHCFGERGAYTVVMEVRDSWGATDSTSDTVYVGSQPIALFTFSPIVGSVDSVFTFDASASSDPGNPGSELQFRWDWEGDDTWDEEWATSAITEHQYLSDGEYRVILQISNVDNVTDTTSTLLHVYPADSWPTATFTVTPDTGSYSQPFEVDASGCTDPQDAVNLLRVRWDWDNDGTWDTNLSTVKTAQPQYSQPGTYTIKLEVIDTDDFRNWFSRDVVVTNSPPVASFTVNPTSGVLLTVFEFDATACSDPDQDVSTLPVQWDWDSDGTWDTNWDYNKTATYSFPAADDYTVTLQVRDGLGLTTQAQQAVTVGTGALGPVYWTYDLGGYVINTSPALMTDGTILFGTSDNYLYALNPDGSLRWRTQLNDQIHSEPTIGDDGTIYTASEDGLLYALNTDGSVRWQYPAGAATTSSPSLGRDGNIYICTNPEGLIAVTPGGSFAWNASTGGVVESSPAVAQDGTIYVGSYQYLNAVTPGGVVKWQYDTEVNLYVLSSPAIGADGTIYFTIGSKFVALNPDGTEKWVSDTGGNYWNHNIAIGPGEILYCGLWTHLRALDSAGALQWSCYLNNSVNGKPTVGVDGMIYIGTKNGYFNAVEASGNLTVGYYVGGWLNDGSCLSSSGIIYAGSSNGIFFAIGCQSDGLASTSWPKAYRDNRNTGRR